jgi:hypothetical protein
MANSPIEDTTDIATQPNALIIGRCVRVCLLTYYYTLIPAHIHVDSYAYTLPFTNFFIFLFIKLFSCLVIFSFIYWSFIHYSSSEVSPLPPFTSLLLPIPTIFSLTLSLSHLLTPNLAHFLSLFPLFISYQIIIMQHGVGLPNSVYRTCHIIL